MSDYLFEHLAFARTSTLGAVEGLSDSAANNVPTGFKNNILWNLGHVYVSLETFAFKFAGEPVQIPEGFAAFFGGGTKPADWVDQPPALTEVVELMKAQPARLREKLHDRLDEKVAQPLVIRSLHLTTIGELLSFSLFHEGMHLQNLRTLRKLAE